MFLFRSFSSCAGDSRHLLTTSFCHSMLTLGNRGTSPPLQVHPFLCLGSCPFPPPAGGFSSLSVRPPFQNFFSPHAPLALTSLQSTFLVGRSKISCYLQGRLNPPLFFFFIGLPPLRGPSICASRPPSAAFETPRAVFFRVFLPPLFRGAKNAPPSLFVGHPLLDPFQRLLFLVSCVVVPVFGLEV